jgi:hypothetical protein
MMMFGFAVRRADKEVKVEVIEAPEEAKKP